MSRQLLRWLAAAASFSLACGGAAPAPHIVLIVVDTLRADHLGAYGYDRPTSPNIDRLARDGIAFTRATAPSSWTKPSVASLFTSQRPSRHGAVAFARNLDPDAPTLAELLRDAGYRTVGVTGNFVHVNETSGLNRGFDVFESISYQVGEGGGDMLLSLKTDDGRKVRLRAPVAAEVNREVFRRLPPAEGAPLFLYVHYMEPHAGYAPPRRFLTRVAPDAAAATGVSSDEVVAAASGQTPLSGTERQRWVDLYDGEIAAVDAAIGALLDELSERGFTGNAILALVSDHGEEFGDHGGWFHGLNLYGESLRVPLVFRDLRRSGAGVRRDDPVDLLDVPTTLLAQAGVAAPPDLEGRDLLAGAALVPRDLLAELQSDPRFEEHVREREQRIALTRWPWKLIADRDGRRALYRLDVDPGEQQPLAPGAPGVPSGLLAAAAALDRESAALDAAPDAELDTQATEGLRALGYAE